MGLGSRKEKGGAPGFIKSLLKGFKRGGVANAPSLHMYISPLVHLTVLLNLCYNMSSPKHYIEGDTR